MASWEALLRFLSVPAGLVRELGFLEQKLGISADGTVKVFMDLDQPTVIRSRRDSL